MTNLKVNQVATRLRQLFEQHLDLSDIGSADKDRESKVLSRCLAATAIYLSTSCTPKDAAEAVWDGSDDNGVDAAFYDQASLKVVLVQSKWISKGTGEPSAQEIGAFAKGVHDVIEQDVANFHPKLHTRLADIGSQLSNPGVSVQMVLISTGASKIAKHGTAVIDKLLKELNGNEPDPIAKFDCMGLTDIYKGLTYDQSLGNVALDAHIFEWSHIASPYSAYFGVIDGLQLKEWLAKYGRRLFADNIRHSLGDTDVNNEIVQTATNFPDRFWYFNNGITLVADDVIKAPKGAAARSAGIFTFKGASIVNGAQTVSSLARVESDDSLGSVRVPVRVIILKSTPPGFGSDVTRTNNFQNRIEPRDFVAQDPEQKRLREEMLIEGVDYQFVRSGEPSLAQDRTCELIEVTTALICAMGDPNLAVQLKTGISRIFADLSKAPYKLIFNPSLSGAFAFNATVRQRGIEKWIEYQKKQVSKKSGPRWGVLVHGNRILAAAVGKILGKNQLAESISDFEDHYNEALVLQASNDVYEKMVQEVTTHYPAKFLAVLFKNPSMSKHIFDLCTK